MDIFLLLVQVMTQARSIGRCWFIGEPSCWDKDGETDKEGGQDVGMNGKEVWHQQQQHQWRKH